MLLVKRLFLLGETKILGKETQEEKTIRHRCIKFRCQGGETFVSFLRIHFEILVITQHRENTNFIVFNRIERVIVAMPILLSTTFFRCCYITTFQKLSNPYP